MLKDTNNFNNFNCSHQASSNIIAQACQKHRKLLLSLMLFGGMMGLTGCGNQAPHISANPPITYQRTSTSVNNDNITEKLASHSFSSPSLDRILISYFHDGNDIDSDSRFHDNIIQSDSRSKSNIKPNQSAVFSISNGGKLMAKPCLKSNLPFSTVCNTEDDEKAEDTSDESMPENDTTDNMGSVYKEIDIIHTKLTSNSLLLYDISNGKYLKLKLHSIAHAKKGNSIKYTFYPTEIGILNHKSEKISNKQTKLRPITLETRNIIKSSYLNRISKSKRIFEK